MNAKDAMIDQYREEEEENQYLDWLDQQQEWVARLVEQGYIPTTKEQHHESIYGFQISQTRRT